jgi:hypothetical protein
MSCVNAVAWVLQALAASCALGGCNQWERLQSYRPEKWTGGHILREKLVKLPLADEKGRSLEDVMEEKTSVTIAIINIK